MASHRMVLSSNPVTSLLVILRAPGLSPVAAADGRSCSPRGTMLGVDPARFEGVHVGSNARGRGIRLSYGYPLSCSLELSHGKTSEAMLRPGRSLQACSIIPRAAISRNHDG